MPKVAYSQQEREEIRAALVSAALELMADDYAGMMESSRYRRSGSKKTPARSKSVTSKTSKPRAKAPPKKTPAKTKGRRRHGVRHRR